MYQRNLIRETMWGLLICNTFILLFCLFSLRCQTTRYNSWIGVVLFAMVFRDIWRGSDIFVLWKLTKWIWNTVDDFTENGFVAKVVTFRQFYLTKANPSLTKKKKQTINKGRYCSVHFRLGPYLLQLNLNKYHILFACMNPAGVCDM